MDELFTELNNHEPFLTTITNNPHTVAELCCEHDEIQILHLNIRSINKHFNDFVCVLEDLKTQFSIIVLTESWLTEDSVLFNLPGYSTFVNPGKTNKCDGTVIFARDNFKPAFEQINTTSANFTYVKLCNPISNKIYNVLTIYRSNANILGEFLSDLNTILQDNEKSYIVVGDINICIRKGDLIAKNYINIMSTNEYLPCITDYTRVTDRSQSCIDHIFIKPDQHIVKPIVFQTSITDHFAVILSLSNRNTILKQMQTTGKNENTKFINTYELNSQLQEETWENILTHTDVNTAAENFVSQLKTYINNCTEEKKKTNAKNRKLKPWITCGLVKSIRVREIKRRKVIKQPYNTILVENFNNYCNMLNELINKTKNDYYKTKLLEAGHDGKQTWKIVKSITNDAHKVDEISAIKINDQLIDAQQNPKAIANEFNKHYINVGKKLAKSIRDNHQENNLYENNTHHQLLEFEPVTETELERVIDGLKQKLTTGPDGISSITIKLIKKHIVKPMLHIINLSFVTGKFPNIFKRAVIKPIHKSGDKSEIPNYRPISLVNNLNKVIEACIKPRLINYLENNNILSNRQFGFRKNRGTQDALIDLTTTVNNNIDNNNKVLTVFLDLAKCFDSLSHPILIGKMKEIGIGGNVLELLKDYLTNRKQTVKVAEVESSEMTVEYGTPQGTLLGPILFLIFINKICNVQINNGKITSYADDTAVTFHAKTTEELFQYANRGLEILKRAFDRDLLSINFEKTKYIIYSLKPELINPELVLQMHKSHQDDGHCDCPEIQKCSSIKYLGVIVDFKLTWQEHIEATTKRIRKLFFKFHHLKNILNFNVSKIVYYALVQSIIQYGIIVWGGAYKKHIHQLIVAQKTIIKIILKKPKRYSSTQTYLDAQILDVKKLYDKSLLLHLFDNPGLRVETQQSYVTRYNQLKQIHIQRHNKTKTQNFLTYNAPKTFNSLPLEIKQNTNKKTFKTQIHSFLLKKYTENT